MTVPPSPEAVRRIDVRVASSTVVAAVASLAAGITTPPRSGPYCRGGCVTYPYTDVASFVPRDYLWMYPALVLALVFVLLAVCLAGRAAPHRRLFSKTGVCFAAIGAGALVVDYGIQLTVMQPALLNGETDGLSPFSQYNPHGVFIGLENVGYGAQGLALLFLGLALLADGSRLIRATGRVFIVGGLLTVVALVLLGAIYGASLDYRFEVVSLLVVWVVLIAGGLMLSVAFSRAARASEAGGGSGGLSAGVRADHRPR